MFKNVRIQSRLAAERPCSPPARLPPTPTPTLMAGTRPDRTAPAGPTPTPTGATSRLREGRDPRHAYGGSTQHSTAALRTPTTMAEPRTAGYSGAPYHPATTVGLTTILRPRTTRIHTTRTLSDDSCGGCGWAVAGAAMAGAAVGAAAASSSAQASSTASYQSGYAAGAERLRGDTTLRPRVATGVAVGAAAASQPPALS